MLFFGLFSVAYEVVVVDLVVAALVHVESDLVVLEVVVSNRAVVAAHSDRYVAASEVVIRNDDVASQHYALAYEIVGGYGCVASCPHARGEVVS